MFSQVDLPIASDEIATPENIQQWKYLHRIIPEMKMDRIEVKTADWCKVPQSLGAPRIHFRSGWWPLCLQDKIGMVCSRTSYISSDGSYHQNRLHCNRIIVEDHATRKHHFAIWKCVKEDGISDLLKKLYAADCIVGGWTFSKSAKRSGDSIFFFNKGRDRKKGRDGVIRGRGG